MTTDLLADVDRLAVRLGTVLHEGTADYGRAWADPDAAEDADGPVPDAVIDVVLAAASRIYRNPDRFVANQAGSFRGALPESDFADGDLFLRAELAVLHRHRLDSHHLTTVAVTRED